LGVLNRIGRGKFTFNEGKIYLPEISSKIKSIYYKLKKQFPYLTICLWHTSVFNEFMIHQPGRFYIIIEAERESIESVFFFLKETQYSVFLDPSRDIIDRYISEMNETLIVKTLVSEAPLQNIEGVKTTTIEKMLVDIFCDDVIFSAQQGSEMRSIFNDAYKKYIVNENRILRYADRRGKKKNFSNYLNNISNFRQ
jgi:hypothetical protein